MNTPVPHFFMSYSREDANLQRRIVTKLRGRSINIWVDVELDPGLSCMGAGSVDDLLQWNWNDPGYLQE
jgi:hypothetical protein